MRRTSIVVSKDELDFIRKNKLSISTISRIAILEYLSGKEPLPLPPGTEKVSIWLPDELDGRLKDVPLSAVIRTKIQELMKTTERVREG